MIDLLILLLRPAVACADNPRKYWYLAIAAILAWFVDIIIARTTWVLVTGGWPKKGEVTVSHTLERLADPANKHPDQALYWQIGLKINRVTKSQHIKVVVGSDPRLPL